jgi:hypothetical protein
MPVRIWRFSITAADSAAAATSSSAAAARRWPGFHFSSAGRQATSSARGQRDQTILAAWRGKLPASSLAAIPPLRPVPGRIPGPVSGRIPVARVQRRGISAPVRAAVRDLAAGRGPQAAGKVLGHANPGTAARCQPGQLVCSKLLSITPKG